MSYNANTANTSNTLIDLSDMGGSYSNPPSKNPFQIQTPNINNTTDKPVSLNDLRSQQNSSFQNQRGFGNW
jgi:hypothetical protein